MKCNICNAESSNGFITGEGFVCSEDCSQIVQGRRNKLHQDLKAEGVNTMPEAFETHDFERYFLKFAICWLDSLGASERKKIAKANPMFLIPEELALDFKDRVLRHIPERFVSSVEHRGHDRLFSGGTYCLRQPVPVAVVLAAMQKAHLIQSQATS